MVIKLCMKVRQNLSSIHQKAKVYYLTLAKDDCLYLRSSPLHISIKYVRVVQSMDNASTCRLPTGRFVHVLDYKQFKGNLHMNSVMSYVFLAKSILMIFKKV